MGTHLRIFRESYSMNTNMTGFKCFSKMKGASSLGGIILAKVNNHHHLVTNTLKCGNHFKIRRKEGIDFYVAFNS